MPAASASNSRNVAILVFDEVEVLDFAGPFEVFSVAGSELPAKPYAPFFPYLIGLNEQPVMARGGFAVQPRYRFDEAPAPDVLLIPGGSGTRRLLKHPALLQWLREQAARVEVLASVCTGALVLGAAGLLDGRRVCTHHQAYERLRELAPGALPQEGRRFVQDGALWTSGGISAGIDMSLALVQALVGETAPVRTEMEWMWADQADGAA